MNSAGVHRPRNLDWKRAAALLYGDWGTSKAYVIGVAFSGMVGAIQYQSLPIIVAVCALTALVAYNYVIICKHFPDGGGVYSAARLHGRLLAVVGALLLIANFTVTASMSAWAAMSYFRIPSDYVRAATLGFIVLIGIVNYFGPKHSGSFAITMALPMVIVVVVILLLAVFSGTGFTTTNLDPLHSDWKINWLGFVHMILALSGVEAIANLTGVMKLDPGSSLEHPRVTRTATKAISLVALEVVLATILLGWAMISLPGKPTALLHDRWEDMLSLLAERYGEMVLGVHFGAVFGLATGIIVGLLLLSAVNTAMGALIALIYMVARDGEMPRAFTRLNPHGVPRWPLILAVGMPVVVVLFAADLGSLMGLYAIGVVGAIAVNLGSCTFNRHLPLHWHERTIMGFTFLVLFAVELTIAKTKGDALFFAVCVLGSGLALRSYALRRAGLRTLTVSDQVAAAVSPESLPEFRLKLEPGQKILVAARGLNPVLRFALEEARLRAGALYVLYVKELAVALTGPVTSAEPQRWQDDKQASGIMYGMLALGKENDVPVIPLFAVSDQPASTILDLSATLGVDMLMLGTPHRTALVTLLKGNVVTEVAKNLPENIQLIIYG